MVAIIQPFEDTLLVNTSTKCEVFWTKHELSRAFWIFDWNHLWKKWYISQIPWRKGLNNKWMTDDDQLSCSTQLNYNLLKQTAHRNTWNKQSQIIFVSSISYSSCHHDKFLCKFPFVIENSEDDSCISPSKKSADAARVHFS